MASKLQSSLRKSTPRPYSRGRKKSKMSRLWWRLLCIWRWNLSKMWLDL